MYTFGNITYEQVYEYTPCSCGGVPGSRDCVAPGQCNASASISLIPKYEGVDDMECSCGGNCRCRSDKQSNLFSRETREYLTDFFESLGAILEEPILTDKERIEKLEKEVRDLKKEIKENKKDRKNEDFVNTGPELLQE